MSQALHLIAIAKKNRATRLDIGNCNLTELPDEVFELTWLEEFHILGRFLQSS
jgi:internalin A